MKSILDPTFAYVPSTHTNIRKTFARVRREQKEAEERAQAVREEAQAKTVSLPRKRPVREESA